MIPLLTRNKGRIEKLCSQYGVRKLEIFGSAVTDRWNPETSDIDLVIDLGGYEPGVSIRYLDFITDMEDLLECQVTAITYDSVRNPYFKEELDETKVLFYEAPLNQAVA